MVKQKIRYNINKEMPLWNHVNALHSSDSEEEAYEHIDVVLKNKSDEIRSAIKLRQNKYKGAYKVLYLFDFHRNCAKIKKINIKVQWP